MFDDSCEIQNSKWIERGNGALSKTGIKELESGMDIRL